MVLTLVSLKAPGREIMPVLGFYGNKPHNSAPTIIRLGLGEDQVFQLCVIMLRKVLKLGTCQLGFFLLALPLHLIFILCCRLIQYMLVNVYFNYEAEPYPPHTFQGSLQNILKPLTIVQWQTGIIITVQVYTCR